MTKYFFGEREFLVFPHCVLAHVSKRIFLSFRFYVKSNLADFKMSKTAILKALNFDFRETHLMMSKIPKISKFRAPRMTQMADFETLKAPKN